MARKAINYEVLHEAGGSRQKKRGRFPAPVLCLLLGGLPGSTSLARGGSGTSRALFGGTALGGLGSNFFHRHICYPLSGEIFFCRGQGSTSGFYQSSLPSDAAGLLAKRPGQTPKRELEVLRLEAGSRGSAPTFSQFSLRLSGMMSPRFVYAVCLVSSRWFIGLPLCSVLQKLLSKTLIGHYGNYFNFFLRFLRKMSME